MSAEWNVILEGFNSPGRRTRFTPVRSSYGRILFKFSTTKNGHVKGHNNVKWSYKGTFTWLYGNMIFLMFRCSPWSRESFL